MRRFIGVLGLALAGYAVYTALLLDAVHAQVVQVQIVRPYTPVIISPYYVPPVYVNPPGVISYYPPIAPSYAASISTYPQSTVTYSYYAPPAAVLAPVPGVYTTRTYYGYGIFRPRGYYNETTYAPFYP